jgi:hypothetical protein
MGKFSKISVLIMFLSVTLNAYALMVVIDSPYPDFYEGDSINDAYRFDTNFLDNTKISLNNKHITEAYRITVVPPNSFCGSSTACKEKISKVDFYLDNTFMNTELTYPYDLKHSNAEGINSEMNDEFSDGYHIVKAIVTKIDNTTLEMFAQFAWGALEMQQFDNLTLYYFTSDKNITVAWDSVAEATHYDLFLWHLEREEKVMTAKVPQPQGATAVTLTFKVPRTGHYTLHCRSVKEPLSSSVKTNIDNAADMTALKKIIDDTGICDASLWWNDTVTLDQMKTKAKEQKGFCSVYISSLDEANSQVTLKDSTIVNKGWWMYGHVASPTGGGISK